jgi:hypothetical protein
LVSPIVLNQRVCLAEDCASGTEEAAISEKEREKLKPDRGKWKTAGNGMRKVHQHGGFADLRGVVARRALISVAEY